MTNLGHWISNLTCSVVYCVSDRFFTQLLVSNAVLSLPICCSLFEQTLVFFCKASNFCFSLCITLLCQHSMTLFIKILHSPKVFWSSSLSKMVSFNSCMHVSLFIMNNSNVLFMDLICSLSNFLSAFLIIWRPLDVLTLVLSLILTGIASF